MSRDVDPDPTDSITLGQLKAQTAAMQKQKTELYDYTYADTDSIMNELDEFYPYIEMGHVAQNPSRFEGSFNGEWTKASIQRRRAFVEVQLEYLESPVNDTRRAAQGRLLYLLQGCFAETACPEEQLHWIRQNAELVRSVDGVSTLVYSLRDAAKRYDSSEVPEKPLSASRHERTGSSNLVPVDPYDANSAEIMDVLAMLYFMVVVFNEDESFGDELMATDPPLPLMLISMVAGLKDRMVPKGYPVKKLLLLLWKTLLACLGGMTEAAKAKALSRQLAGLGPERKDYVKASPMDITSWRRDTATKYPTFAPTPSMTDGVPIVSEQLADSMKPLPARPNYHSTEIPANSSEPFVPTGNMQPGTPAPTPPQTPLQKPKKLQFQTDPSRPFVFPYSQTTHGPPASLVPYAIDEADKLYHQHAYVSLGLYQLWEAREECLREERGLGKSGLIGFSSLRLDDEDDQAAEEALRRDWEYEEEEATAQQKGDEEGVKLAREKRNAARRLYRVEVIYRAMLPAMQNTVIVLLKLLLATVTSTNQNVVPPSPTQETAAAPPQELTPPTMEEVDVARHREITSKAVSAIVLLLLKWFKASHILKFHHLTSLLLDSNCLVLVLKIFGLQEVLTMVQSKNELPDCSFFRYIQLNVSKGTATPPSAEPQGTPKDVTEDDDEVELIKEYSWRNFFSAINLVKILQKITKHRIHRILLMCQYKSSAILKRVLRVNQPMLQLQVLKLVKSQMPYCGRKWRSTNMKIITSIYLNCRPELRNDWLVGVEADLDAEDGMVGKPQELALRALIAFYNKGRYAVQPSSMPEEQAHRRTDSSAVVFEDAGMIAGARRRSRLSSISSSSESELFPLGRVESLPYNPDGMIEFWMHEYEDVLREVFGEGTRTDDDWEDEESEVDYGVVRALAASGAPGPAERDDPAWLRLTEIMRARGNHEDDAISDSESVVTVGELGEDARLDAEKQGRSMFEAMQERQRRRSNGDENTWEHMSPTTLKLLRRESDRRRSSSSGSPLRPIMGLRPMGEDLSDVFDEMDEDDLPGPMPINPETRDEMERDFNAVDEVEFAFGE